jgi:hypothetical protein
LRESSSAGLEHFAGQWLTLAFERGSDGDAGARDACRFHCTDLFFELSNGRAGLKTQKDNYPIQCCRLRPQPVQRHLFERDNSIELLAVTSPTGPPGRVCLSLAAVVLTITGWLKGFTPSLGWFRVGVPNYFTQRQLDS